MKKDDFFPLRALAPEHSNAVDSTATLQQAGTWSVLDLYVRSLSGLLVPVWVSSAYTRSNPNRLHWGGKSTVVAINEHVCSDNLQIQAKLIKKENRI